MNIRHKYLAGVFALSSAISFSTVTCAAQDKPGAIVPWTTYEAEHMVTTGTVLGPKYDPYLVETESSGQQCVKLVSKGQFVEFTASVKANGMVIRYNLPDAAGGNGLHATLGIYKNGKRIQQYQVSSRYTWQYGKYPFSNDPSMGSPRHFYDELRVKDLTIEKGDILRIQRDDRPGDDAGYCIVDLVDLENIAPPLKQPTNSLSITDFMGTGSAGDYTNAFRNCIAKAIETGKSVWIPVGTFKITGDIHLPENVTIQGAGMWYSELMGDEAQYTDANKRVRLIGSGSNIHISDFAVIGKLTYRSDNEANDGIVGAYGTGSTISRIWIEHTKVGMWIENSMGLKITDCRMRNTMADGINFCTGMSHSTIANCTARGTGDDCFAIWPTINSIEQKFSPGNNLIIHCTGQLPYLANGASIYGAESNKVAECLFVDISQGSAILLSTTFPTESADKSINNNFSGTTVIENCTIKTSGGFDHDWAWRAAVEICLDKRSISGVELDNVNIDSSFSNAISVIAKNEGGKIGTLSNAILQNVNISGYGIGIKGRHALFISAGAHGSLTVKNSNIPDTDNEAGSFTIKN